MLKCHLTNHLRLNRYPPPFPPGLPPGLPPKPLQQIQDARPDLITCPRSSRWPTGKYVWTACFARSAGASFMGLMTSQINTCVKCHNHTNTRKMAAMNVPQPETATVFGSYRSLLWVCALRYGVRQSVIASGLIRHQTTIQKDKRTGSWEGASSLPGLLLRCPWARHQPPPICSPGRWHGSPLLLACSVCVHVCVYLQCAASDGLNTEDSFQVCLHVACKI